MTMHPAKAIAATALLTCTISTASDLESSRKAYLDALPEYASAAPIAKRRIERRLLVWEESIRTSYEETTAIPLNDKPTEKDLADLTGANDEMAAHLTEGTRCGDNASCLAKHISSACVSAGSVHSGMTKHEAFWGSTLVAQRSKVSTRCKSTVILLRAGDLDGALVHLVEMHKAIQQSNKLIDDKAEELSLGNVLFNK